MNEISRQLGVAKSSVSLWTRHLDIDPVHKDKIANSINKRTVESYKQSAAKRSETAQEQEV